MEHYIINADTGRDLKVKEHSFFYSQMGSTKTESELKKIGLGKDAFKKVMELINEKSPSAWGIELFIMTNFPIMKVSIYGGDRNISFTYFKGVSTAKAVDSVIDFCAAKRFPNIEIFNEVTKKHIFTRWDEIKEDDSVIRTRLGAAFLHFFINTKTKKELRVSSHDKFMIDLKENPSLFRKIDLNVNFYKEIQGKQKYPCDYYWLMENAPIMRVTRFGNTVFEYAPQTNSKQDVIRSVYDFCSDNLKDEEIIFIGTTTNRGVRQTVGEFKSDYDKGVARVSMITKDIQKIARKLSSIRVADIHYLFDPDKAVDEINKLKGKIDAGFVNAYISTLGGKERASIMLTITLEPKDKWPNNIKDNATIFQFDIARNGYVENFRSEWKPAMRKFIARDIDDVIMKINDYLKKGKRR